MQTLITYAAAPGPQCQAVVGKLDLPNLQLLLQLTTPAATLQGSHEDLTPLHERVLAQTMGLEAPDGLLPWAALDAARLGLTTLHGTDSWAWITPCHWNIQTDHVDMVDPLQLALTSKESETFWRAMQPHFSSAGISLFSHSLGHYGACWLAHGAVLKDLPTASLDRVCGQAVDLWIPRQEHAKTLRQLQSEMQMLLYIHPANDARSKFNLASVNSFWVSGTGGLPPGMGADAESVPPSTCTVRDALRGPALHDDPVAWSEAWEALDSTTVAHALANAQRGQPVQLTLCGEKQAVTLENRPLSLWSRLERKLSPSLAHEFLRTL